MDENTFSASFTRPPMEPNHCACEKAEEDSISRAEKSLVVMKKLVKTAEGINAELPEAIMKIDSGRDRGSDTVTLTVVIK